MEPLETVGRKGFARSTIGSMADESGTVTVAEMRRRRRAREALNDRVKDLTDAQVVASRKTAADLAEAKAAADVAAAEALAVAIRVYGGPAEVTELTGIPVTEVERAGRAVPTARVRELLDGLQGQAEAKLSGKGKRTAAVNAIGPGAEAEGTAPAPGMTVPAQESAPAPEAAAASVS